MHASQYLVRFAIIVHSESHTVCLYACVILANRGNWRQEITFPHQNFEDWIEGRRQKTENPRKVRAA